MIISVQETRRKKKSMNDETYDYLAAVKSDVRDWMDENRAELARKYDESGKDVYEVEGWMSDELFVSGITGNDNGSYTCNRYEAESYLCHNLGLLVDAVHEFAGSFDGLIEDPEAADVTIRCYVLGQAIDELAKEFFGYR